MQSVECIYVGQNHMKAHMAWRQSDH